MKSSSRQIINRIAQNPTNPLYAKPYATNKVFTPKPTSSSNESLNNNPAITFARKNKPSTVVQHPEWVVETCKIPGCDGKLCINLCGEKRDTKSIGHMTHSDDDKLKVQKLADTDLENRDKPVYVKKYDLPHDTVGESYDPIGDDKKSDVLQKYLKDIQKNSENDNEKP
jgi:hypothetical protein